MLNHPEYAFGIMSKKGFGKSSIIKECCRKNGIEYIDIRLATIQEDDLGGLPRVNGEYYEYKAPKWAHDIAQNPKQKYLLLFDEWNQASPEVLNALFDIILGDVKPDGTVVRRIANIELPKNVGVCVLGNTEEDNQYVTEIPPALSDRVLWLPFENDLQQYKNYLIDKFGKIAVDFFDKFNDISDELNPRNVERFLQLMMSGSILYNKMEFIMMNFVDEDDNAEMVSRLYNFLTKTTVDVKSSQINNAIKRIKEW